MSIFTTASLLDSCGCCTGRIWHARRAFLLAAGASAAAPVLAQVEVGSASSLRKLVPAETLENSAAQQYQQMLQQAKAQRALAPAGHPQLQRLHAIAKRLIPHAAPWNDRARQWRWEVNLIGSSQVNAFCMPGGKIAFYTGILDQLKLTDDEKLILKPLCLMTLKPAMYVGNVMEDGFENNPYLDRLREHAAKEGAPVVALCAKIEAELADLDDEDKLAFLADLGLEEPGLNRLIRAGYQLLGLQTYFTAGVKEVRAWTIHVGDTAPQAAGVIHTDFERGFIRAQTIAFEDFIKYKGEAGAKEAGKMRSEGKEYVVKDGDVLNFLFNV